MAGNYKNIIILLIYIVSYSKSGFVVIFPKIEILCVYLFQNSEFHGIKTRESNECRGASFLSFVPLFLSLPEGDRGIITWKFLKFKSPKGHLQHSENVVFLNAILAVHFVLNARNENLLLPINTDLLHGFKFLLTGEDQEEYIKDDVITKIKAGGGEVLQDFHECYPLDACRLISNMYHTTAKFFMALVLDVKILSFMWVQDCCLNSRLTAFESYLLPAGKNLITEQLVQQRNRQALRGLNVRNLLFNCYKLL